AHVAVGGVRSGACDRPRRNGERRYFGGGSQPSPGGCGMGIGWALGLAGGCGGYPARPFVGLGGRRTSLEPYWRVDGHIGDVGGGNWTERERLSRRPCTAALRRVGPGLAYGQKEIRAHCRSLGDAMRRGMIFKARWGWMGVAESETGLVAIVLPQNSKAA